MPGDIRAKERTAVTLTSAQASLSNGTAVACATNLDARAGGNAGDDFACRFELTAQWATITGIAGGTIVAELYLVPSLDGTNFPDVDTTGGASRIPINCIVGNFEAPKAPIANTDMRFVTNTVYLDPLLYKPYLKDTSGQVIAAGWTVKVVSAQGQYT